MARTPAVFIGHGSPTNTFDINRHTQAWANFGRSIDRPKAILSVSAHWYVNVTAVTAMDHPKTIHDFFGFSEELFAYQYPAAGSGELADRVVEVLHPTYVGLDRDSWGFDHGTWSVLAHMFPQADIPVVQLSIDATKTYEQHFGIGEALAPLRDEGVLILCSGNVVHNLRRINWSTLEGGYDWADDFDRWAREIMASSPADILDAPQHPHFDQAVPTPDHFLPLLYAAGLAHSGGDAVEITGGCSLGSISMTSWSIN
jgi:4,5-DOPA dioxygenase extradiol